MSEINGIYAASVSILDKNLKLDIDKTIKHAENLIEQGCHGVAIFGSTGQAQLISLTEKMDLIEKLSKSKFKNNFIIGTGLNSLNDTITLINMCVNFNFEKFLVMPPAYYLYGDKEVKIFFRKLIEKTERCKIILYNFEKLCGYKFSIECVEELAADFPKQIIGVKDSSYNLYEKLKIPSFSILPGSELKLLKGLELGCSGIITATCNVTASLSRQVYDDFHNKKTQSVNQKLCDVRSVFDKYNLISGMHTYLSQNDNCYKNILPPLSLLEKKDQEVLFDELNKLNFKNDFLKVA